MNLIQPKEDPMNVAYRILKASDKSIYWKDLVMLVIKEVYPEDIRIDAALLSEIYTQLNLDGRFSYQKGHLWTLTELLPPETKRARRKKKTDDEDNEEDK